MRRWPGVWLALWTASQWCTPPATGWAAGEDTRSPFGVVDLPTLELRREYNDVAAAIDTIVRVYGRDQVDALSDPEREFLGLPAGAGVVVLFWADDEAELFLNGNFVGNTRLTPTRVEIPSLYLQTQNELRAHCWDTDRVESGFMAGLYVEDAAGLLYPVLTTSEGVWETDVGKAQEIYYSHTQPDIPEAQVVWGDRLFGEVRLVARFSGAEVLTAMQAPPVPTDRTAWREEPMHFHQVVSRLVELQGRQRRLGEVLAAARPGLGTHLRYRGDGEGGLSFTLGRAAPLAEARNAPLVANLAAWVRRLPARERELVLRDGRELKGVQAATAGAAFEGERGERLDRRADYQPPPERGAVETREMVGTVAVAAPRAARRRLRVWMWVAAVGLSAYVAVGAGQWWRVYNSQGWERA